MTKNVYDNALMLQFMICYNPCDWRNTPKTNVDYIGALGQSVDGMKIAVAVDLFEQACPDISGECKRAAKKLQKQGVSLQETRLPDLQSFAQAQSNIMLGGAYTVHEEDLRKKGNICIRKSFAGLKREGSASVII